MNKNQIIQDYGSTVSLQRYLDGIQMHPYIPQSDQCIHTIVDHKYNLASDSFFILDVGCGPDRLTSKFAERNPLAEVIGVDISSSFIDYVIKKAEGKINPLFLKLDFANAKDLQVLQDKMPFNVITMQGVMHHIHGSDRDKFFINAHNLLDDDGVLIIGDEFIRDYETNDDRIVDVAKFYCHIIDEARKGGFPELAQEEAKNLIDDCFSGTKYAGCATEETFKKIYRYSEMINSMFYEYGTTESNHSDMFNQIQNLFRFIKETVEHLTEDNPGNFNRGDYKVSIDKFVAEAAEYGFTLSETYKFGPVDQLGGMGVLVFKKQ